MPQLSWPLILTSKPIWWCLGSTFSRWVAGWLASHGNSLNWLQPCQAARWEITAKLRSTSAGVSTNRHPNRASIVPALGFRLVCIT